MSDKGLLALTLHKDDNKAIITMPDGRTVEIVLIKHKGYKQSVILFSAPKDIQIDRGTRESFHK